MGYREKKILKRDSPWQEKIMHQIYEEGLAKTPANYEPLSPLAFLARSSTLYPEKTAVVYEEERISWREFHIECKKVAYALVEEGVGFGDTVAAVLPNIPEMMVLHFAVPMVGAVLNTINVRLDAATIRFILKHGETKVLFTDKEFSGVVKAAVNGLDGLRVIDVDDRHFKSGELVGSLRYDEFKPLGGVEQDFSFPKDEWDAISLNYTSGTTGDPKGVVYHHRGAYLNAANNALTWGMGLHPRYLWTLPMFHCNGWCFPWTLAAVGGSAICIRNVRDKEIFNAFRDHKVTHFCGAPVVLNTLLNAPAEYKENVQRGIKVMTAGAAPPASVIKGMESLGFEVIQVYGLTETYGPMIVSEWREDWDHLPPEEKSRLKARQGVQSIMAGSMMVGDPSTMEAVPWDGETRGEVFMRGNIVMKGYLKNKKTTEKCFEGGWFHSGDIAVCHPDGYIEIKDRTKDIIISGGENISSIEIEAVLFSHSKILEAAVVAKPDEKWGEHPCAFVSLKPGEQMTAEEVINYCKENLARFKVPKTIVFQELEKTSTGKIQKFRLREIAKGI